MKSTVRRWSIILAVSAACARGAAHPQPFGTTNRGEAVSANTLKNAHGIELQVLDYDGITLSLRVPYRTGRVDELTLGFGSRGDLERRPPDLGFLVRLDGY